VRLAGDYKPTRKKFGQNMPDAYTYKKEKNRSNDEKGGYRHKNRN